MADRDLDWQHYARFSMADEARSEIWFQAVREAATAKPSPTVVEVGVGSGGRLALAALALRQASSESDSKVLGFDRFESPLDHTDEDVAFDNWTNNFASESALTRERLWMDNDSRLWIDSVRQLCESTGFDGQLELIKGDIEIEGPNFVNSQEEGTLAVDVLSISCNWASGVRAALVSFFPLLAPDSFVLLDGYYFWGGFRSACDTFGISDTFPGAFRQGDCLVLQGMPGWHPSRSFDSKHANWPLKK